MEIVHYPVLHEEVLANLPIKDGDSLMIDCTTGEGGHTSLFLSRYPDLKVIGLDRDRVIQQKAIERLRPFGSRFTPVLSSFDDYLESAAPDIADAILFDLGISMFHYVESERGFSFRRDEVLDMRLDPDDGISAADVVNGYSEEAPRDYRYGRIHPATRTFQALRIEVNGELSKIEPALESAIRVLRKGGRIGVITFHSLEDRIVKWFFKEKAAKEQPAIRIITKKPIVPTEKEEEENAPSRSAKLRVIEKI